MGAEKSPGECADGDLEALIDHALSHWPRADRGRDPRDERVATILARIEREGRTGSKEGFLLNAPLAGESPRSAGRAVARGPWPVAGATATVVLAAAAALLVALPRRPPVLSPSAASASVRGAAPRSPQAAAALPDEAIDPSSLPRAPGGDRVAESAGRPGTRTPSVGAAAGFASAMGFDGSGSLAVDREPRVPVPVGADRIGQSSADPERVPLRPAVGAVESAVARVLPEARACLKSGPDVVRATLTFASSGRVKGVVVVGMEAGAPIADCVRDALAEANVGPFATPAFVWTTTVRGR